MMEGFLMDPVKDAGLIEELMNIIGKTVANSNVTESILGTAIKVYHI